jgi:hypothetical protein
MGQASCCEGYEGTSGLGNSKIFDFNGQEKRVAS